MDYPVIFEGSDVDGWSGYVPDLPGVGVKARSLHEARTLLADGIAFHIEGLRENGLPVPPPSVLVFETLHIPAA